MTMDNGMDASPSWEELMKECRSLKEQVKRLNAKLEDINDCLYGRGFEISNYHLNGNLERLDVFFEDNDWAPDDSCDATGASKCGVCNEQSD